MAGNPNWCNINGMRTTQHLSPLIPSSSIIPQYPTPSLPLSTSNENQQLPYSWSQLLLGGGLVDEDRSSFSHFQPKKVENWEDQTIFTSSNSHLADVKQESSVSSYFYGHGNEEFQAIRSPWGQVLQASSPTSCVTTYSSNMLDFSHTKMEGRHQEPDHSSECNSTTIGSPFKKAKVQSSTVQSSIKVRKEKLGERITALHQLVSPFGKTDTASVLLEAIGYIRFLQSQIEALSSPYLATAASPNMSHPVQGERSCLFPEDPGQLLNDSCLKRRGSPEKDSLDGPKKDLRSRGLCLVPLSCTLRVGSDNGADYWAPNLGGGFR